MTHEIKCDPEYFYRLMTGQKKFEVRKNDRDYQSNDVLLIREFDRSTEAYSGRELKAMVVYVLHGGRYGIQPTYCVLGIELVAESEAKE